MHWEMGGRVELGEQLQHCTVVSEEDAELAVWVVHGLATVPVTAAAASRILKNRCTCMSLVLERLYAPQVLCMGQYMACQAKAKFSGIQPQVLRYEVGAASERYRLEPLDYSHRPMSQ
jgi:hypothetical protein